MWKVFVVEGLNLLGSEIIISKKSVVVLLICFAKFRCANAAEIGHLKCLIEARAKGIPWHDTAKTAAHHNSVACFIYAVENGCPWDKDQCLAMAYHYNHPDIVNYIEAKYVKRCLGYWSYITI